MTSTYPIAKGIPMPSRNSGSRRTPRFPVKSMSVGDSFLIPERDVTAHVRQAVRSAASYYKRRVATRVVKGGIRVWRVK